MTATDDTPTDGTGTDDTSTGSTSSDGTTPIRKAWTAHPLGVLATVVVSAILFSLVAMASNTEPLGTRVSSSSRTIQPIESFNTSLRENVQEDITAEPAEEPREPIRLPQWLYNTLGVLVAAGALWFLALQRLSFRIRRANAQKSTTATEPTEEEQAEEIVAFTIDLIDELGMGGDPRQAIQRAYAAVETGFGSQDLARKPAETPAQYLHRVLGRNGAVADPLERLTALFEQARYSSHDIDESMRTDAIAALSEIRDSYRTYTPARLR